MQDQMIAALESALQYSGGERSLEDCLRLIEQKALIPLCISDQFIFVEVFSYPQKQVLNISYAAGTAYIRQLDSIMDVLLPLAKALDCSAITCYGRPGWEKVLARFGAKKLYTVLALEV